jgi:hypothetical protein
MRGKGTPEAGSVLAHQEKRVSRVDVARGVVIAHRLLQDVTTD